MGFGQPVSVVGFSMKTLVERQGLLADFQEGVPLFLLLPIKGPFLPLVNETNRQEEEEESHGPEPKGGERGKGNGPREKIRDLQVKDQEEDGHQVEAHIKSLP